MVNKVILNKQIQKKIYSYLTKVSESGIEITGSIVFGSQVKGNANKSSDIDLAVVSPDFGPNKHQELVRLYRLIDVNTKEIEPIPLNPLDLEDTFDPLIAEISKYGVTFSFPHQASKFTQSN